MLGEAKSSMKTYSIKMRNFVYKGQKQFDSVPGSIFVCGKYGKLLEE